MKKSTLLIIVILAFNGLTNAQKSKLVGSWLMTKAEVGGEVQNPYFVTDFHDDGKMFVMGMDFGTWEYNKNSNAIIMKSDLEKDFNGEGKILNLTEKELIVNKDGSKLYYRKVDIAEIEASNKNSGLMGMWEFKDVPSPEVNTFVTFSEPDEYTMLEKDENSTGRYLGTWIFDKQEMSLILIGMNGENVFKGEIKVIKISEETIELRNNGKVFKAKKVEQSAQKIERLTFSEGDFYTEDGDYKYEEEEQKLPWQDWDAKKNFLINVKQLVYNYSVLMDGSDAFDQKVLSADVQASPEEEWFNIDYIFNGFDRYNLPEDTELQQNAEYTNSLYPLNDYTYRVTGNEQVTTPAGTFDCTVLEAISERGLAKKLWLINGKPGIYAKIIEDDPDPSFGHYYVYELKEIK